MWNEKKAKSKESCFKCKKDIEISESYLARVERRGGDVIPGIDPYYELPYCLNCGNEKKKEEQSNKELKIKEQADKLFSEIKQLWDDLELKVETENLSIKDVQRINSLKNRSNKLLKEKGVESFDTYWMAKADFDSLREEILPKLDNFIKENASPKTLDEVKDIEKMRGSRIKPPKRTCSHNKIEPCTDDPTWFNCSYCWEQNDSKFLSSLCSFHERNLKDWIRKHNLNTLDFFLITDKLLPKNFTTQDQIKQTYQQVVNELNDLAKSKGIDEPIEVPKPNNPNHRERERERESKITIRY